MKPKKCTESLRERWRRFDKTIPLGDVPGQSSQYAKERSMTTRKGEPKKGTY